MKTAALLLVFVITLATIAGAGEIKHAPTLEACTADINLWVSELKQWPKETPDQARKDLETLTYADLADRSAYLNDCLQAHRELADEARGKLSAATTLILVDYSSEMRNRLVDFIERHSLFPKFTAEDATGKR